MCLSTVSDKKPPKSGYGWKCFWMRDGKMHGICHGTFERGKWLRASKKRNHFPPRYRLGFHIHTKRKDAATWIGCDSPSNYPLIKVKYRGAHTIGEQRTYLGYVSVIVADEIFIPRPKRKVRRAAKQ